MVVLRALAPQEFLTGRKVCRLLGSLRQRLFSEASTHSWPKAVFENRFRSINLETDLKPGDEEEEKNGKFVPACFPV